MSFMFLENGEWDKDKVGNESTNSGNVNEERTIIRTPNTTTSTIVMI